MSIVIRNICQAVFLGLVTLTSVAPAVAATVTFTDTLPISATSNPLATGTSGLTTVLSQNVTGTVMNVRRSPWDAVNSFVNFNAPSAVYSSVQNGMAFFNLGVERAGVSFVWGTPGPLNVFELFLKGTSQVRLTGTDAIGSNGVNYSRLTNISDVRFDRIEFTAGRPAFEFANLTVAAVPLPAGGLLLLAALGGLAVLRRRVVA
jgi:hypothetical protein